MLNRVSTLLTPYLTWSFMKDQEWSSVRKIFQRYNLRHAQDGKQGPHNLHARRLPTPASRSMSALKAHASNPHPRTRMFPFLQTAPLPTLNIHLPSTTPCPPTLTRHAPPCTPRPTQYPNQSPLMRDSRHPSLLSPLCDAHNQQSSFVMYATWSSRSSPPRSLLNNQ